MKNLKQETIKKFEELKNKLNEQDLETNYCDMVDIAIDYDNEAQDELYLYDTIQELHNFVDEEKIKDIIENEVAYGISRIRYFIGETYNASIYKINDYGNLENVEDDDFVECIDECIEKLKEE